MAKHSFNTLMLRLSHAGFKRQFVTTALMPEWWDESCAKDPSLLPDIEVRVARFLNAPLSAIRNAEIPLMPPSYADAQLRRVRDIGRDRLVPAIHAAIRVAGAVVRNLRYPESVQTPPTNALQWRQFLTLGHSSSVQLGDILGDLWAKGIAIVPLDMIPTPSFQGLACIVDGHPVIVLGHKHDEPGRVAFLVAHEAGHLAAGECSPGMLVVDEDQAVQDGSDVERQADRFAKRLLVGDDTVEIPAEQALDARELAQYAINLENQTGADASSLIYDWAARTLNYADASMAVKALYRSVGARRQIRKLFDQYVDSDSATESDRALLRCVYGEPQPTTVAN